MRLSGLELGIVSLESGALPACPFPVGTLIVSWGPLPVETRVTAPPPIFVGGGANNAFGPPNFEKFIIIVI